jgi:hypothetical protein
VITDLYLQVAKEVLAGIEEPVAKDHCQAMAELLREIVQSQSFAELLILPIYERLPHDSNPRLSEPCR